MRREEWTPSRHQYLCSEHFTEDCFDIRWGIRYLKNTAIPTIFPSTEDDGEKKVTSGKRSPQAKPGTLDIDIEPIEFDSSLGKRPLILSRTCKKVQSSSTDNTDAGVTCVRSPVSDVLCHSDLSETPGDGGVPAASCLALPPCAQIRSEEHPESVVTVLCCETLGSLSDEGGNLDTAALQAALGQAFSFVPVEMVLDEPAGCFSEDTGLGEGEHTSAYEHSYCRPDTDKEQLWSKILSLHAKIVDLDRREESTVAKIRALETEIALLKRDGAVFKEKQKVLEDYISSVLL